MNYLQLREANISKSLIKIDDIDQNDVSDYNEFNDTEISISDEYLKELNDIMKVVFNYITCVPNVYVMIDKIEEYFHDTENIFSLVSNLQLNILCKLDPEITERTPFELFNEIFQEIVHPLMLGMIFDIFKDEESSALLRSKTFNIQLLITNNCYPIHSMYLDALNSFSHKEIR